MNENEEIFERCNESERMPSFAIASYQRYQSLTQNVPQMLSIAFLLYII